MATYVIGDLQGCWQTLQALLRMIEYKADTDRLYCLGDLVNRGPDSLSTLRWAKENRVRCVLGNHDVYALACYAGVTRRKQDTLDELLDAPERDALFEWLRRQPLLRTYEGYSMVHGAYAPSWDESDAIKWANDLHTVLAGPEWKLFLKRAMTSSAQRNDPLCRALSVFTRGRYFTATGAPDFSAKGPPENAPAHLKPWYAFNENRRRPKTILFGHWASLKHRIMEGAISLDGGVVWGGALVALRLEDGAVFQREPIECDVIERM